MILLLVFLFGVLSVTVAGITLAANHFAPAFATKIASGLVTVITRILESRAWLIFAGMLTVPPLVFAIFGHHLRARRQAWSLLAIVLLLSFCVTGINVAFSYIGKYFTNALVDKNQDLAYTFVAVYFGGFLLGSHRCPIQLRAELPGGALARVDDRGVSQQLFQEPQLLRN